MKTNEFKIGYEKMEKASLRELEELSSCCAWFFRLTDKQLNKVYDLLLNRGFKKDEDGTINFGIVNINRN